MTVAIAEVNSGHIIGYCGLGLHVLLLAVTLLRGRTTLQREGAGINVYKKFFYAALALAALFDIMNYLIMIGTDTQTAAGYSCHLLSLYFNTVTFFCVMLFWSSEISFFFELRTLEKLFYFVCGFNGIFTFACIIIFFVLGFDQYISDICSGIVALDYAFVLSFSATLMLIYGLKLHSRLYNHLKATKTTSSARIRAFTHINVVLFVCCLCFYFRSLCLVYVFLWNINSLKVRAYQHSNLSWFFISLWLPLLVSVS